MKIRNWMLMAGLMVALVAVMLFTPATFAQGRRGGGPGNGTGQCAGNYVDADGDGVCDNAGTGQGPGYVDADGDGVCDNAGTGRGAGRGQRQP